MQCVILSLFPLLFYNITKSNETDINCSIIVYYFIIDFILLLYFTVYQHMSSKRKYYINLDIFQQ